VVSSLFTINWHRAACIAYFVSYLVKYVSLHTMNLNTSGTSLYPRGSFHQTLQNKDIRSAVV